MITRRRFFETLAVAALAGATGARAAEATPEARMEAMYRRLAAGKGDSGGQIFWTKAAERPKWFSSALVSLWAAAEKRAAEREDELGPIDFDPFTNSQDPLVETFTVKRLDAAGPVSVVQVTLAGRGEDGTLVFHLVRQGDVWKIDDILGSSSGDRWSLRQILSMP